MDKKKLLEIINTAVLRGEGITLLVKNNTLEIPVAIANKDMCSLRDNIKNNFTEDLERKELKYKVLGVKQTK